MSGHRFSFRSVSAGATAAAGVQMLSPRAGLRLGAALRRQILGIGLVAAFLWALRDRVASLDPAAILAAFAQVSAVQWAVAILATFLSFAALAQYDALIHRMLATGTDPRAARRAGWAAIALSQTIGFGLVSGALVRWRMLPATSLAQATKITATVAATFLAAWAVLTAHVLLLVPVRLPGLPLLAVQGLALFGLALGGGLGLAALIRPALRLGRFTLRLPPLAVAGRILALAALDTGLAALALWALLPAGAELPLLALYPAFLLALGAGFVSGTPGGVGPFEITLVTLLPGPAAPDLLAAILGWRVVYYAAPAALAMALVALRPGAAVAAGHDRLLPPAARPTPRLAHLLGAAPQAELGLLRQGEHGVWLTSDKQGGWVLGRSPQALVALLDPFGTASVAALLPELRRLARDEGRLACLYKISPRIAAQARAAGWVVAPVASEVWLDPRRFTLESAARAGLRRKLRKAQKAGLRVETRCGPLGAAEAAALPALARAWAQARGGERGFSMGRFAPDYLAGQMRMLAWHNGALAGFASFHANAAEWVLDLMRPAADAPDGTMQALVAEAIAEAARCGVARLSLAALPPLAAGIDGPAAHIWRQAEKGAGAAGLRQFKMSFAPQLSARYIAAPSRAALALAAADIARTIHRPPPLPAAPAAAVAAVVAQPNPALASPALATRAGGADAAAS